MANAIGEQIQTAVPSRERFLCPTNGPIMAKCKPCLLGDTRWPRIQSREL